MATIKEKVKPKVECDPIIQEQFEHELHSGEIKFNFLCERLTWFILEGVKCPYRETHRLCLTRDHMCWLCHPQ